MPSDAKTTASRISEARSRPKVRIRIDSAGVPDAMRLIAHSISVVVLPVPVAPRIISGEPRWAMAASCSESKVISGRVIGLATRCSSDGVDALLTV